MGEQLVEEVVPELTNDLVENVRVPDIGCNRAFSGKVSSCTAPEAGAWECTCLGPVNIHWNNRWKHGHREWGERDQSVREPEPEQEIHPLHAAEERWPEAEPEDFRLRHGQRLRIAGKHARTSRRSQ
jgi:hypothetical protein